MFLLGALAEVLSLEELTLVSMPWPDLEGVALGALRDGQLFVAEAFKLLRLSFDALNWRGA